MGYIDIGDVLRHWYWFDVLTLVMVTAGVGDVTGVGSDDDRRWCCR